MDELRSAGPTVDRGLVAHAALMTLLGLLSGFTPLFAPRVALSAHTVGVLQGALLFGLAAVRRPRRRHAAGRGPVDGGRRRGAAQPVRADHPHVRPHLVSPLAVAPRLTRAGRRTKLRGREGEA